MNSGELIGLHTGRNRVALAEQFEVVNERLHAFLHHSTRGWNNLVIIDLDSARGHLVQALKKVQGISTSSLLLGWEDKLGQ